MKKITITLLAIALIFSSNLFAQKTADVKGSRDYPLVSRFRGSHIVWYQVKNFDRYYMLKIKGNKLDRYEVDGKVTRIQYAVPKIHSVFEIYRSYETALKNAGFKILLTLNKDNCGLNLSEQLYIGEFNGLNALTGNAQKPDYRDGEFSYLSAKKEMNGKDVYIVVYITNWNWPLITFDAIEVRSMEKDLVSVQDLQTALSDSGHIAIYDIHFDSGKAEIKPESAGAIKVIADYLNHHSDKKYIVVGHTDNTGSFEGNLKLSKARADAVRNELISKFSVRPNQLISFGDGQTAPVANNTTEEGRAKNRRVEIVVR